MESSAWCNYLVPAFLAIFGLGMALFLSNGLKKRKGKIEQELEKLACLKTTLFRAPFVSQ
jgi:hypothetical protein